jgi:hypothetical protein
MITKHFFNLVECYSEQGRCIFNNFSFNPAFLVLFKLILIVWSLWFMFYLFSRFRTCCSDGDVK